MKYTEIYSDRIRALRRETDSADDSFVEDKGWYRAAERYSEFLREHENGKVLFLECAVGMNTPPVFYVLNPIQPKMAKNSRFYPENG